MVIANFQWEREKIRNLHSFSLGCERKISGTGKKFGFRIFMNVQSNWKFDDEPMNFFVPSLDWISWIWRGNGGWYGQCADRSQ